MNDNGENTTTTYACSGTLDIAETRRYGLFDKLHKKRKDITYKFKYFLFRKALSLLATTTKNSNSVSHAKREFVAIGYDVPDDEEGPNKWMVENVLELLVVFSAQGHSGFSAPYCIDAFKKLASFEPLSPLTGNDDEWGETYTSNDRFIYQNKRCSHVFKEENGKAYDINGKTFRDPDRCYYTDSGSSVDIEFPYTPKTEYIDVDKEGNILNNKKEKGDR